MDAAVTVEDVAARIAALPGVEQVVADEAGGAPELSWGDRFFFVGPGRTRPFATMVQRDVPGFDELSRLDRPGVFRVNVETGREGFEREFGLRPRDLPAHLGRYDFAAAGVVLPHPAYGTYGWASVVAPTAAALADLDRLLTAAHARATARALRHSER